MLIDKVNLTEAKLQLEDQQQLIVLLREHHAVFTLEDVELVETSLVTMEINTGSSGPVRQPPRQMSSKEIWSDSLRKCKQMKLIIPS